MIKVLDEQGNVVRPELVPKWDDAKLREIYELMIFIRTFDQKLISLQRQGRCGTYVSVEGQEACQIGSTIVLEKTDVLFPSFRESGVAYVHGVSLEKLCLYWMGNEWGSNSEANVAPVSIPVGTHAIHAVGYAWAQKLQKKSVITVSYFGDGGTSTGDFYEAMNFAGVFKAPTILFCQNNQWAISTPRSKQSITKTLAQKAIAAGIPGVQVDGNDIFAVAAVMADAADRARKGHGATFIEAVTYRLGHHTTSDDSTKYRDPKEVEKMRPLNPILRYKLFLQKKNLWTEDFEKELVAKAEDAVKVAVEKAEKTPPPGPNEMFDFVFEKPTQALEDEKKYFLDFLKNSQ